MSRFFNKLFSKKVKNQSRPVFQSFILEPILTPSGLIDVGDEASDLGELELLPEAIADFDFSDVGEVQGAELEGDLEILSFFTGEEAIVPPSEPIFESGVFTVGKTGEVGIDFLFDGGRYQGELGIFSLEGMEDLEPGSEDFIQEAALRASSGSELGYTVISDPEEGARFSGTLGERKDWNGGEYQGVKTVQMRSGDRFALILVPNGNIEDLAENPELGGAKAPLFSLATANPEDTLHLGQIADVTGDGSTFVWEDVQTDHKWYDRDFNDLIVQFRGATGEAPYIEEVMDGELDWRETELGQELLDYTLSQQQPSINEPIPDLVFEGDDGLQSFDLGEVFVDPTGEELSYELVTGNSDGLQVELEGDRLTLTPLEKTGITEVTVKASDRWGEEVVHTFTVTTNHLSFGTVEGVDEALTHLTEEIAAGDLLTGLESEAGEAAIAQLEETLEKNPELIDFLVKPDSLKQLGVNDAAVETLQTLLDSPEIGEAFGFSGSLGEAMENPVAWEQYLINAGEALEIVPEDAPQTTVGFLDFAGEHGEQVTEVFTSVNPRAAYDLIAIENGNWAEQLIGFVDGLKEGGEERGIVNLSFDLTQTDVEGRTTTRYELTEMEQKAIAYARENNILLVAAAGNTGDRMSALGAASEQFDNIITVGAVNKWEETADYSARGQGLTLVATGGQWESDRDAFVGTSKATSYVTGAASLVWAANPDLNYQQVKDLLISTATDLGEEGWDTETGAGLLDVADAVMMAGLATPLPLKDSEIGGFGEFAGEGRVDPNERAVSDKTEKAIVDLSTTQNRLIDEWTVLWLLGNPELTLDELDTEVKTKVEAVLGTYQEASTEAAKNSARVEQLTEALTLATSHDRIERERLQGILTRQQDLIALVAQLSQQKTALEQGSAQQKAQIEDNIVKAEEAIAQATAKLDYLLIDPQTLLGDADELRQQATAQLQLGQTYRQQAQGYESDRQNHEAQAKIHDEQSQKWQVVGYTKSRSGSRKEKWGWVTNTEQVKLRDQHQWEAEIAAQNAQTLGQLAAQLEQQGQALNEQANLVENNNIDFSQSQGKEDDADRVLELLQQQAETQTELASAYWQQAEMLEKQRIQNQRKADWHKEQSRRWEVVGKQKKRSGRDKDIYGWREYPEHIPLMQQAQQLADTASQELAALQQLAHQTQQESDRLTQQVERLDTLVNEDWQKIKQGIEYEILAQENRLQGEKDLLVLTTAKTEQDLATLALKMSQTETELSEIESDRTILEQSVTQTEQRLNDTRSQWEKARKELASTQQNLQQFLDTSGHFLPYRERLIAVEKNIEQLELEKVRTEGIIAQLQQQFTQNPVGANSVQSLEDAQEYLEALERDLQWAKVQQDSFSLSALDSPQRLELKALLKDLEDRQAANISSNSLPLQQYLDFLQQIETGNTNLLTGFDDLQTRLTEATGEQAEIEKIRDRLQAEYRKLGLEKTNINALDFIPKLIEETNTDIQEQQEILRDRQTQIDDAYGIVEQFEKQRQEHQEQAEYWDSKINQWEIVGYQKSGKSKKPVYDWVYHPEAEAQRDTELAAAETAAQHRDEATLQTQTLEMSLQPEMEVIQGKIAGLELKRTVLETSQNSSDLEQQITDKETEIGESLAAIANEQIVLSTLTDSIAIAQQQQKLSELDRQLDTQQQERGILDETLAYREQLLQAKNSKLSDKYREIELTEGVLAQIEKESDRLQSRLDLINRADELETQFKTEQEQWQESSQAQITAIDELLATREQGESDRAQLLALRSQLSQVQGELQQAQTEIQQLEPTVTSAQEVLALTDLQLGNQELQLQSLNAQDAPLQSAEAGLYSVAEQLRQEIWYWDGSKWAYQAEKAAEYRQALQGASLMADRRNQLWPKIQDTQARIQELTTQQVQQQTEVQQLESQLSTLENKLPQLETQVTNLKTEIAPIAERIKPLEELERQKVTAFQNAAVQTQENAGDLAQTTDKQVQALRRLISFGILASESDVDFFFLEIEPKIQDFRDRLQQRNLDFTAQAQQLNQLITSWEQDLANTTDDISRQAITAQIDKAREQVNDLAAWKSQNETAVSELETYLNQANDALKSLRLQQELQVRQEIASNEKRVESLQAQLRSENATELALNEDTVLAYADLGDRVREDLETVAKIWTENLQLGHNKTKELGEQQGKLSQSVDDLIAEIENNFADPHGEYKLSQNELRDAIATLGILAPRSDELGHTVTSAEQSIEKILIRVQEDAKLWQEIAPIATRYGLESQELEEYQQLYQLLQKAQKKYDPANALLKEAEELEKKATEALKRSETLKEEIQELQKKLPRSIFSRLLSPEYKELVEKQKQLQDALKEYNSSTEQAQALRKQAEKPLLETNIELEQQGIVTTAQNLLNQAQFDSEHIAAIANLRQNLQEYQELAAKQTENEVKSSTIRQDWENLTNYNPDDISQIEFKDKLVQAVRDDRNYIYVRYSKDGGHTWTDWTHKGGAGNSNVRMLELDGKLFQFIKGTNNIVYGRHSTDGENWTGWSQLSGGIIGDFAIDAVGNQLMLSIPVHNNKIAIRVATNGIHWSGWHYTPQPTLTEMVQDTISDRLIQSYQGVNDRIYTRDSADGQNWTNWQDIDTAIDREDWRKSYLQNLQNSDAFKLEKVVKSEFQGKQVETVIGPNNLIYVRHSKDSGATWSDWTHKGGSAKEIQVLELDGKLFQVIKGTNNVVYIRHSTDGENWTGWGQLSGGINGDFAIDAVDNRLVLSIPVGHNKVATRVATNGIHWSGWQYTPKATLTEIVQETIAERLIQSYQGIDDRIYTRDSADGQNWTNWQDIETAIAQGDWRKSYLQNLQSSDAFELEKIVKSEFQGKQVETVIGKDNLVYVRHSEDNGGTWTDWTHKGGGAKEIQMVALNGKLFQVVRAMNNTAWIRHSTDGKNWTGWGQLSGGITGNFVVDTIGNRLVVTIRNHDNRIYTRSALNGLHWSGWETGEITLDDVAVDKVNGKLVQSYQDMNGKMHIRYSTDGLNWTAWENYDEVALEWQRKKEAKVEQIVNNAVNSLNPIFVKNHENNGSAIDLLIEETQEGRSTYQPLYETAKAKIAEGEAAIAAGLAQADWYEKQAAIHLAISEKLGPDKQQATWTEDRRVKYRGRSGKTKWKTVTITHVNHDWIVWDNYTKLAADLRKQAATDIKELAGDRYEKERWEPLSNHWSAANDGANQAAIPINEARNLFEQLEAERESLPQEQEQLNLLQNLLPTLKQQLTTAQQEAETANAKVLQGWLDYDADAAAYRDAIATIQTRRGELDRQAHTVQNELVEVERWVENQNVALAEESEAVDTLRSQLQERLQEIRDRLPQATGNELQELQAKEAQLARSLQLLTNKAAVLTEQKTTLTQKRVLLTAQNEVILAEQRLLDAYLVSPDDDFSALQQQLQQARTALAEAQRLAEKAASDSVAITDPLQATQADLLAKNDAHLTAAKEKQAVLKGLLEATQLNANYTLEAFQKQQELNDLEFQVLQRLQAATIAGNDEAQHLLEVAQYTSLAAAAEIYHRDYRDLASDNGSRCSGGLSRPEDRMLADQYYQEWLNYNELKRRAEEQASAFTQVREAAETEIASLQEQQEAAANRLNELNEAIATTEEEIIAKEQELAILEARVAGLERLREQTEQTFIQLLTLEQLNLSQAQLEQQLAQAYQEDIDRAVKERLERDRLEVVRHRLETQAKIEQLRQLQAEENLRLALNQVRSDVGLASVDGTVDAAQLQGQLAALLSGLQALGTQQTQLPDDLQALLAETQADLYLALQGDEAKKIEGNLLKVAEGLIEQINQYKAAIAELELEEQQDEALLQQAEQDLQGSTRQLLQAIEQSQTLGKEREILTPLNLEVLQKVAYAEQAIEISEELAKQSKDLLEEIIKYRKEERKQRKNAFWNETLGTLALVLDLIGTVLSFIPALNVVGLAFKVAAGVVRGIMAAINGDWAGAIYNIGMSILSAAGVSPQYKTLLTASYQAYRASEAGDDALAFLQVVQGVANVIAQGLGTDGLENIDFTEKLILTLGQTSATAYQGIKAIESGNWEGAISSLSGMAGTIGVNFASELQGLASDMLGDAAKGLFEGGESDGLFNVFGAEVGFDELKKTVETAFVIAGAAEEGGIDAWLAGVDSVLGVWKEDIQDAVNKFVFEPDILELSKKLGVSPEKIKKQQENDVIYYTTVDKDGKEILIGLKRTEESESDNSPDESFENKQENSESSDSTTQTNESDSIGSANEEDRIDSSQTQTNDSTKVEQTKTDSDSNSQPQEKSEDNSNQESIDTSKKSESSVFSTKAEAKTEADLGLVNAKASAKAEAKAGVQVESQAKGKVQISAGGLKASGNAEASAGIGAKAEVEAKASLENGIISIAEAKASAKAEVLVGTKAQAKGDVKLGRNGLEANGEAGAFVGAKAEVEGKASVDIGIAEAKASAKAEAFAGAEVGAKGKAVINSDSIVASGKVEAFAGAKAKAETKAEVKYKGQDLWSVKANASANAGIGGTAGGELSLENGKLSVGFNLGATLGIGANVSFKTEINLDVVKNAALEEYKNAKDAALEGIQSLFGF